MKKRFICFLFFALLVLCVMASCASTPVSQKHPEKWEKTYIGMSLEEFKQVWPEAKYNGTGDLEGKTEIWAVIESNLSFDPKIVYFSFQDNKLIKFMER